MLCTSDSPMQHLALPFDGKIPAPAIIAHVTAMSQVFFVCVLKVEGSTVGKHESALRHEAYSCAPDMTPKFDTVGRVGGKARHIVQQDRVSCCAM